MNIGRERYLDDGREAHVTLTLATRTATLHSVLADAPPELTEQVGDILVDALDRVQAVLRPVLAARQASPGTTTFGCGT